MQINLLKKIISLFIIFEPSFLSQIILAQETLTATDGQYRYPIILKGRLPIIGQKITSLRAYSFKNKTWHPIPMQIEEINSIGDYVLEGGLPFTKDTDDGFFDANDEVVLKGNDLGDSFSETDVLEFKKNEVSRMWGINFSHEKTRFGSVLIVSWNKAATNQDTPSFSPVVTFDEKEGFINSPLYHYQFRHKNPVLLGEVVLRTKTDEHFIVFEKSAFKMIFNLPWWMPNFSLKDSDFESSIESWQVGPIRTIVAVGVKFKSFLSIFNFHMFSELVFYENMFQIPTVIEFSYDPSQYLQAGSGLAYSITLPLGKDWMLDTNLMDLPELAPQETLEKIKTAADTPFFYATGRRAEGSFLVKVRVDERARNLVPPPFLIRKSMFGKEPWVSARHWFKDFSGDLGLFLDISNVKKGTYDFGLDLFLSSKADEHFQDYNLIKPEWFYLPLKKQ